MMSIMFISLKLLNPERLLILLILPIMCTNTKTIVNPIAVPKFGTKAIFDVPCNSCKQCLDAKVRGYLLRNFLEYKAVTKRNGFAFFDTLTYNNDCIPQTHGLYHFDSVHVKNFMKRLRINLFRNFGVRKNAFKFWLVCEYGGLKYRPHYHVLFYVYSDKINLSDFKGMINKSWTYGFTDSIFKTRKHVLTSCAAVRYLTKYLSKYREFDSFMNDFGKKIGFDFGTLSKEDLRRFRPFLRQSVNLGYNEDIDLLSCDFVKVDNKDGYDLFCYSDYYKRKQLYEKVVQAYDVNGKPIYARTDSGSYIYKLSMKGLQYKTQHYNDIIANSVKKYQTLYSAASLDEKLKIDFLLDGRPLEYLAIFKSVFSYRLFDLTYLHLLYDTCIDFKDFAFKVYQDSLQITARVTDSDYFIQSYFDNEFSETKNMYSILSTFEHIHCNLNAPRKVSDEASYSRALRLDRLVKQKEQLPCSVYYKNFKFN